jgi:hypothetical protein
MAVKRKKKAAKKKKPARETLVVGSKVKAYIKANGYKCSGDLVEALSNTVHEALDGAMSRCDGNKRATVRPVDL